MPVTIGGSGPITGVTSINTTVSDTELGYLDGVTSALQTQLAGKADTTGNGAWTTWTPTWTGFTVGNATVTAKYVQFGKFVSARVEVILGSTSSVTGAITFTLPVTAVTSNIGVAQIGGAVALDAGTASYPLVIRQDSTTAARLLVQNAGGTYLAEAQTASTVPFTWGTNDGFAGNFFFEAA